MTVEQYREFEKKLSKQTLNNSEDTLVEMLRQAEQAKREGMTLSKGKVFELFRRKDGK